MGLPYIAMVTPFYLRRQGIGYRQAMFLNHIFATYYFKDVSQNAICPEPNRPTTYWWSKNSAICLFICEATKRTVYPED